MLQFTDFFIAKDDNEASSYDVYNQRANQLSLNGVTDDTLIILWACLENTKLRRHHELIFVEIESDDVLYRLPALLVKLIANIEENNLSDIAIRWAEHEDIQWPYEKAKEQLQKLILLAQETQQKKYNLYLLIA